MRAAARLKHLTGQNAIFPAPEEFRRLQWKKGWALSVWGLPVYGFLRLIGKKPGSFHGICPYFSVGREWGGLEFGWFFLCCRDADERLKMHELGHGVANANIGGFCVLRYSIGSAFRYWYRRIRTAETPYDAWWYEGQATQLGREYVRRRELSEEKSNGSETTFI